MAACLKDDGSWDQTRQPGGLAGSETLHGKRRKTYGDTDGCPTCGSQRAAIHIPTAVTTGLPDRYGRFTDIPLPPVPCLEKRRDTVGEPILVSYNRLPA